MDQEAIVARLEGDHAYVEVGGAGCGRCHETGGCQSGILGQLFRTRPRLFRLANSIGAVPGDPVVVRVAEGATLRAALLIYALPVAFLLLGAVAGTALGDAANNDAAAAIGALSGFVVGVLSGLTLRKVSISRIAQPVLLRPNSANRISKEVRQ